jgi:hypothetical protein
MKCAHNGEVIFSPFIQFVSSLTRLITTICWAEAYTESFRRTEFGPCITRILVATLVSYLEHISLPGKEQNPFSCISLEDFECCSKYFSKWLMTRYSPYLKLALLSMWDALSDERTCLSFVLNKFYTCPAYTASTWIAQKTSLPTARILLFHVAVARTE